MRPSNELRGIDYCLLFFTIWTLGHAMFLENTTCEDGIVYLDATSIPQTIHSSNYPARYDNNQDCMWKISAPLGAIKLTVHSYDIENVDGCYYDSLNIYDGPSSDTDCSVTLCGYAISPTEYITSSSEAFIHFHSDGSETNDGFILDFQYVDLYTESNIPCEESDDEMFYTIDDESYTDDDRCDGSTLDVYSTSTPESIQSPNFPWPYENDEDCRWIVHAPQGLIKITVEFYDIEFGPNCVYDRLIIYDGALESACSLTLCGSSNSSEEYITSSSDALIQLLTDSSIAKSGFTLTYQNVDWDATPTIPCTPLGNTMTPPAFDPYYGDTTVPTADPMYSHNISEPDIFK